RVDRPIGLHQLKCRERTVADPDRLVERTERGIERGGGMVEPVAPAKAMQPAAPLLEKSDDGGERGQSLDAIARVIAAARMRPAGIALLAAGADRDDFGLALGSARALERDIERKQHLMEGCGHDCRVVCCGFPRAGTVVSRWNRRVSLRVKSSPHPDCEMRGCHGEMRNLRK